MCAAMTQVLAKSSSTTPEVVASASFVAPSNEKSGGHLSYHTRFPSIISNTRKFLRLHSHHAKKQKGVPKGHIAVYVGDSEMKRYVVPLTYLKHHTFQDLLRRGEEEND